MGTKKNALQVEIYKHVDTSRGKTGWRWRMWRSGHIVASGPFGRNGLAGYYVKRAQCRRTLLRLMAVISKEAYVWRGDSEKELRRRSVDDIIKKMPPPKAK